MSECVVRMEMPRDCWLCPNGHPDWIYNDEGSEQMVCFCSICNTEDNDRYIPETETERPDWCPILCELPEKHGRLVDADDYIKHLFTEWVNGEISNSEWCDLRQWMNEATTIVPAEMRET